MEHGLAVFFMGMSIVVVVYASFFFASSSSDLNPHIEEKIREQRVKKAALSLFILPFMMGACAYFVAKFEPPNIECEVLNERDK